MVLAQRLLSQGRWFVAISSWVSCVPASGASPACSWGQPCLLLGVSASAWLGRVQVMLEEGSGCSQGSCRGCGYLGAECCWSPSSSEQWGPAQNVTAGQPQQGWGRCAAPLPMLWPCSFGWQLLFHALLQHHPLFATPGCLQILQLEGKRQDLIFLSFNSLWILILPLVQLWVS